MALAWSFAPAGAARCSPPAAPSSPAYSSPDRSPGRITDVQSPAGAIPETATQTLARATGVATIARWTAEFLPAQLGDAAARLYVYGTGDAADPERRDEARDLTVRRHR